MSFIIKSINSGNKYPIEHYINNNINYDCLNSKSKEIVDEFCDTANSMEDLTEIDKIVLISNYLQSSTQYCNGKITTANNRKYETEYEGNREDYGNANAVIEKGYGNCNAISATFHIMAKKLGLKVDKVDVGDHSYCIYQYNDEIYIIDATFGCSRNENQLEGVPKATKFSDKYIMVSLNDLKDTGHHILMNMMTDDRKLATKQLDRSIIGKSVEKLKNKGIKFEYSRKAIIPSKEIRLEAKENEIA